MYEEFYHKDLHNHLLINENYYLLRSKLALMKYFKDIPNNAKILDFGCGLGQNIFLLRNAIGYDISEFSLDFCRKKGITVVDSLDKLDDSSFDFVFSCHVIEHLENPFESLKLIRQKLKENGIFILVLPHSSGSRLPLCFEKSQHLYSWTFGTINNLLFKSGFKVLENKYLRGIGYRKLLFVSSFSFRLYNLLTQLISFIYKRKEMMIIAKRL